MTPLTTKGLEVSCPGDGTLKINSEGEVKKFVPEVFEKTFSGDEAVRRGQKVFYVTERAVFRRTGKHDVLELVEIAPGIDLQKGILDQLDFTPAISPKLKTMDPRIFTDNKMNVTSELFGTLKERSTYHEKDHIMYLDLFGITLNNEEDVKGFFGGMRELLDPLVKAKGLINMIVQYDGFDLRQGLEDKYTDEVAVLDKEYYRSVERYHGAAFHRARLGSKLRMSEWDPSELYDLFDVNHDGELTLDELRNGMEWQFKMDLTSSELSKFQKNPGDTVVDRETFAKAVEKVLKNTN
jgi:propionate CoA-transferase